MNWFENYLIKQAVLFNPARPNLNWQLGLQAAKKEGVPVFHSNTYNPFKWLLSKIVPPSGMSVSSFLGPKAIAINTTGASKIPLRGKTISFDPTLPGVKGESLSHELDEIKATPTLTQRRVISIPSTDFQHLYAHPPEEALRLAPSIGKKSIVHHNSPEVLLNEAHRMASGQVSPQAVEQMIAARKATGEYDALRYLGVDYGHTLLPQGGRAYNKALQRFKGIDIVPKNTLDFASPSFYNVDPEAAYKARSLRLEAKAQAAKDARKVQNNGLKYKKFKPQMDAWERLSRDIKPVIDDKFDLEKRIQQARSSFYR